MALPTSTADASRALAVDAGALASLGRQARSAPQEALRGAAAQFEALFLQRILKSMREAMPQDGPLASDTARTYTEMLDAQLAQTLARRGTGIADMLVKQISRATAGPASAAPPTSLAPRSFKLDAPAPAALPSRGGPAGGPPAVGGPATRVPARVAGAATAFVETMRPYAEKAAEAVGLPVHYLLAQAGLETGWGRHQPRTSDGAPSHNLFGIKAGTSWKGPVVEAETTEFVDGKAQRRVERFRAYASPQEAFHDFASVLARNGRYARALSSGSVESYAASMQQAGYATDPAYGDKLARTIRAVEQRLLSAPAYLAQVRPGAADKSTSAA